MPINPQTQLFSQILAQRQRGQGLRDLGAGIQSGTSNLVEALQRIQDQERQERLIGEQRDFTLGMENKRLEADRLLQSQRHADDLSLLAQRQTAAEARSTVDTRGDLERRIFDLKTKADKAAFDGNVGLESTIRGRIDALGQQLMGMDAGPQGAPPQEADKVGARFMASLLASPGKKDADAAPIPQEDIPAPAPGARDVSKSVGFQVVPPVPSPATSSPAVEINTVDQVAQAAVRRPSASHVKALMRRLNRPAVLRPTLDQKGKLADPAPDPGARFAQELARVAMLMRARGLTADELVSQALDTLNDDADMERIFADSPASRKERLKVVPGLQLRPDGLFFKGQPVNEVQQRSIESRMGGSLVTRAEAARGRALRGTDASAFGPSRSVNGQQVSGIGQARITAPTPVFVAVPGYRDVPEMTPEFAEALARGIAQEYGLQ